MERQPKLTNEAVPTLVKLSADTERGTFARSVSGRWTADERCEAVLRARVAFWGSLQRADIRSATLRTRIYVESPLFGWCEVEA